MTTAIDLLLTGDDMRTVDTLQVGHERLRLRSCLGICQNIRCLVVFRLRRLGKRHVVVQAVTPAAAKGDGVLALGQLDVAPAVIVPALCVGDFHVLRPCAVIRTCDANRCLTGFANVAQIHQASGHQAVHARFLSAMADERSKASALYRSENNDIHEHAGLPDLLRHALYASKLISYAQGFSLLKKASEHYQWNLDYGMLAKIWRKGCIIRSVFLEQITRAYHALPGLENLLFDDFFRNRILEALPAWRKITADCLLSGIPIPCMAAALTYFDGLRTERSSANLIQAQRDYFGAHTYERTDMERGQFFHTDWNETGGNVSGTYNA